MEILDSLHKLDPTGQSLRYITVKDRGQLTSARPDHQRVDVPRLLPAETHTPRPWTQPTLVLYGVSGMLDDYRQYQQAISKAGP